VAGDVRSGVNADRVSGWRRLVRLPAGRRGGWLTLTVWVFVVGLAGWLAGRLDQVQDNDETNWMPAGAGSTRAAELARQEFAADVICQEEGTTGLPRPRDHLVAW